MIFVTVGTSSWNFDRLIMEMDRIAGLLEEEVIIQTGISDYAPKNCKYFKFCPKSEMDQYYDRARLVVAHAGVGTISNTINKKKPIIVVPRYEKTELFDNHQKELTKKLEEIKKIVAVYDIKDLESKIKANDYDNINFDIEIVDPGFWVLINNLVKDIEKEEITKSVTKIAYKNYYISFIKKMSVILPELSNYKVLNIGAGGLPIKGATNLDRVKLDSINVVHDLNEGLPFEDNSYDLVVAFNVLEHFTYEKFEYILQEMYRVSKTNSLMKIQVPYFSSDANFSTLDHKIYFAYNTFWRYRVGDWDPTTKKLFKNVEVKLVWHPSKYLAPLNFLISKIVNSHYLVAMFYQTFFCWILPMRFLDIVILVEKSNKE